MLIWLRNLDNNTTSDDINQYISIILIYFPTINDLHRFIDLSNTRIVDFIDGKTLGARINSWEAEVLLPISTNFSKIDYSITRLPRGQNKSLQ